jgi:transketolase
MHHAGYDITKDELATFRKIGSRLEGHPFMKRIPALETTSGPLGEGLSQSAGFALGAKMDKKNYHIWCLTSDAEHQEGMTWEGVMLAGKYRLDNLTVIIDRNNIQIDGVTEDVMPIEPLKAKYEAFNWHVMEINGHEMREIIAALEESKAIQEKPVFIIANTIPGKGVDFMENDHKWHGIPPDVDQAKEALAQLKEIEEKIKQS